MFFSVTAQKKCGEILTKTDKYGIILFVFLCKISLAVHAHEKRKKEQTKRWGKAKKRLIMTEDIIKSITAAEETATQLKREAQEKAAKIVSEAEDTARGMENSAEETCKAYVSAQVKQAQEDAEKEYEAAMLVAEKNAQAYCETALANAGDSVGNIVGRILGGNR